MHLETNELIEIMRNLAPTRVSTHAPLSILFQNHVVLKSLRIFHKEHALPNLTIGVPPEIETSATMSQTQKLECCLLLRREM